MQSSSETPQPTRKSRTIDLTGKVFGNLRVVARAGNSTNPKNRDARWNVLCEKCGRTSEVRGSHLKSSSAAGSRCLGCKPPKPEDAPPLVIDQAFVRLWTPMICTAAARVLGGFNRRFRDLIEDILSDTFVALSRFRGNIHPKAMSTFVFNTARLKTIDRLDADLKTPKLHASGESDAPNSYDKIIGSLTDATDDLAISGRAALFEEVFEEALSPEEKEFAVQHVQNEGEKDHASCNRMWRIRLRLRERLRQLEGLSENSKQGVHDSQ